MANPAPVIGSWYRKPGGETFEVVAIDTDDRTIEIQYFDGAVEELDLEDWVEEEIALTEAPEDWTGSVDVEPEDYENEVENQPTETRLWADPLQYVDRGEIAGYSEIELPERPTSSSATDTRAAQRPRSGGSLSCTSSATST